MSAPTSFVLAASRRPRIAAAVRDNLDALSQALELLAGLDAERYARRVPVCFNSAAGGHLRHVIEHYASLLAGWRAGAVDYEARARDARMETEPAYAAGCIATLCADLGALAEGDGERPLRVRAETVGVHGMDSPDLDPWADSTILRELEFLLSHTIHHYALIAVICGVLGHPLPKDFGVAPSTLRFRRAQASASQAA
jgi:hypothetical protein